MPSSPGRPTPRWPRPTPTCGSPSARTSRAATGIEASTPEEQADVLAFLCSHAARYINGLTVVTDAGYVSAGITGSFPDATPVVNFLRGNY